MYQRLRSLTSLERVTDEKTDDLGIDKDRDNSLQELVTLTVLIFLFLFSFFFFSFLLLLWLPFRMLSLLLVSVCVPFSFFLSVCMNPFRLLLSLRSSYAYSELRRNFFTDQRTAPSFLVPASRLCSNLSTNTVMINNRGGGSSLVMSRLLSLHDEHASNEHQSNGMDETKTKSQLCHEEEG